MITINGSTSSQWWSHAIDVYETDYSVINNTSTIKVKVYIGRYSTAGASYFWGANWDFTVNCTGVASKSFNYYNPERVDVAAGAWFYVGEVTFYNVPHNSDGSKTVTISDSFSGNGVSPESGSASGQFTLTKIDRTAPTVTTSVTVNSDGTITVRGSANVNCNIWQYSVDNGSWTTFSTSNGKSATNTINVSEATHTVNVRARKTSNNVYGTGTAKTVDTAKPTVSLDVVEVSVNQITIGITSNTSCDRWEYSLDNGETWVVAFTATYQGRLVFKIEDLPPNTFYIIAVRARKASNGLYGQSASRNVKTLGGATYVSDGSGYKKAVAYVSDGTAYKIAMPYIYTIDGWKPTEY